MNRNVFIKKKMLRELLPIVFRFDVAINIITCGKYRN